MGVAWIEFGPGGRNSNDRLIDKDIGCIALIAKTLAIDETVLAFLAEPVLAPTAKFLITHIAHTVHIPHIWKAT